MNQSCLVIIVSNLLILLNLTLPSAFAQNHELNEIDYYLPRQVSQIYVKQDLFFKKKTEGVIRKNVAITISIPADLRPSGLSKHVGSFKYDELLNVLKQDERAIWVNPFNPMMRFRTEEALENSWYNSEIYQYQNPITDKIMYLDSRDSVRQEKEWEIFREIYTNQGDLLKEVRSWQLLDSLQIKEKPKRTSKLSQKHKWISSIWLKVDFSDSGNISFNGENREFSRIVIDAVFNGMLTPYKSDKLQQRMTLDEFKSSMKYPVIESDEDYDKY